MPSSPNSQNPPALVLGGWITVLGTIRCLEGSGVSCYCATKVEPYISFSRHYHRPPAPDGLLRRPADLPRYLHRLPLRRAVLIPCADDWVRAVAELPPEIRESYPSSAPSREVLAQFLDKAKLEALLDRFQVPRPRTHAVSSAEALAQAGWSEGTEWFLKPTNSQSFRRRYQVKAFRVSSLEKATALWHQIHDAGLEVVLQEYVAGPASNHYFIDGFVDREGRVKALFARRRIRIEPPDFGDSSSLRSVALEEVAPAAEACQRLLQGVSYRGIFSAEFKLDAHDGLFKLIEVNTRPWANVSFAASCGVNAPLMAYRDALGQEVGECREYAVDRRFCFFPADFAACRRLRRSGQLSLWQWMRFWMGAKPSVFSWSDPLPGLRQSLEIATSVLTRRRG